MFSGCAVFWKNCAAVLADPSRPQIELDYIERLLKDYLSRGQLFPPNSRT